MTVLEQLSRKDIRILLHLIGQGEEVITDNRNKYETHNTRKESEERLRKRLRHIRTVLSMSEEAKEEA